MLLQLLLWLPLLLLLAAGSYIVLLVSSSWLLLPILHSRFLQRPAAYTKPGLLYPLKFAMFWSLLQLRRLRPPAAGAEAAGGYGRKSKGSELDMERVQPLSDHEDAIDAGYFNGYSRDGWYIGAGIQRRHGLLAECVMLLRAPAGVLGDDADILEWPWGPATDAEMPDNSSWSASGLQYHLVEPMRKWRVTFEGQLRQRRSRQLRKVSYDLTWTASTPYFDFDTDMHPSPTCAAIAREPWSRDFFKRLEEAHQTHYEQFGKLEGTVSIEGVEDTVVSFDSMRDRTFGKYRVWNHFHRYILQYFVLEDSTCIAFHLVSLPVLMTHLITGFVITPDQQKLAITDSTLNLWQLGESEPPPDDYDIGITVAGGQKYKLKVHLVEKPAYYCGWNWEAKLYSVLAEISCQLPDGCTRTGRGMCEFEYRHLHGRGDGRKPNRKLQN